jgi:hypothetical protein
MLTEYAGIQASDKPAVALTFTTVRQVSCLTFENPSLKQITEALHDVFADRPEESSQTSRRQSKADCLSSARQVIDACSAEELRSEAALERFLETTVRNAKVSVYSS